MATIPQNYSYFLSQSWIHSSKPYCLYNFTYCRDESWILSHTGHAKQAREKQKANFGYKQSHFNWKVPIPTRE